MVRWAFALFLVLALFPLIAEDVQGGRIFCARHPTPDADLCEADTSSPTYSAIDCDYSMQCCTLEGQTACWVSWKGAGSPAGTDWTRRVATPASKMCPPNTCNDGNSCIPAGLVAGRIPGETVCEATDVRCGTRKEPMDRDGGGSVTRECEADVSCRTLPDTVYTTQWLCDRSLTDTTANPHTMPALYSCAASKVGQTFKGAGGDYCCSQDPVTGAYSFIQGACAPSVCPAGQHKELRRGGNWGQDWDNRPSYGPQNICVRNDQCVAGNRAYNAGTTWIGGRGTWGDAGESWLCGASQETQPGVPAFYQCTSRHFNDEFRDRITGKTFCCGSDGVFKEGSCSGGAVQRMGSDQGRVWTDRETKVVTGRTCDQILPGQCTDDTCCNQGSDQCANPSTASGGNPLISNGQWLCMPPSGSTDEGSYNVNYFPALYRCDSTTLYDGVQGEFQVGTSRFCCVEKRAADTTCGTPRFVAGTCAAVCNGDPANCRCASSRQYWGPSVNGLGLGSDWTDQVYQWDAPHQCTVNQCAEAERCFNKGELRDGSAASPGSKDGKNDWACLDTTGVRPAWYRCTSDPLHNGKYISSEDGSSYFCCKDGEFIPGEDPHCGPYEPTCGPGDGCKLGCTPPDPDCGGSCPAFCGKTFRSCDGGAVRRCTYGPCDAATGTCSSTHCTTSACPGNMMCVGNGNCACPPGTAWKGGSCVESMCSNGVDDDRNGEADYDGGATGLRGDLQCPVQITGISAPARVDSPAACSGGFTVTCSASPGNVRSVTAHVLANGVSYPCRDPGNAWYEGNANPSDLEFDFTCDGFLPGGDGTHQVVCQVDSSISYPTGSARSQNLAVDCLRPVQGTVRDAKTGAGIGGAAISVDNATRIDTRSDGTYRLEGAQEVPIGPHDFLAAADGYYSQLLRGKNVSGTPTVVDFMLDPVQCLADGSFGGYCDARCAAAADWNVPAADQLNVTRICAGAPNTSVRAYNSSLMVQCCTGPFIPSDEYQAPLVLKSCAKQLIPHTKLVNYNGRLVQLTVVSYKKCD